MKRLAIKIAAAYIKSVYRRRKIAGPLTNPKHLRYQAVFLMGPAGSGKSYLAENKYLQYMPGASASGVRDRETLEKLFKKTITQQERSLSNLTFEKAIQKVRREFDITIDLAGANARIPFRLYDHNEDEIPRNQWKAQLPDEVYKEVKKIEDVVFGAPVHELPSYWRQVDPDHYKKELPGFRPSSPGYVHEMSSEMSKAYFHAILESGDPLVVDGVGTKVEKMRSQMSAARDAGYRVSLVYVYVPLALSLLRNAARPRQVHPSIVLKQWKTVLGNYPAIKRLADRSTFVDNEDRDGDKALWQRKHEDVDAYMVKETGMTLAEFVLTHAPKERDYLKSLGVI